MRIHPESLRLWGYAGFWVMVVCAVVFHTALVKGVDMDNTPLVKKYGYNNICIFWDYTPSRELTAMIYPFLFEYPLMAYLFLTYLQILASERSGHLPSWFLHLATVLLVLKVTLFAWFRMIFVVIAWDNIIGHTLGFLGLQIGLVLVAVENYIGGILWGRSTGKRWKMPFLTEDQTVVLWTLYIILLVVVTVIRLTLSFFIFADNPLVDNSTASGAAFSASMDRIWMALAAVCPIFIALFLRRTEPSIFITVSEAPPISSEANEQEKSVTL